jgi:lysophospholipase L1-like esterase
LFSGDRFHPSGAGYRVIAEALMPVVLEAAEAVTEADFGGTTPPAA